jgi:protein SCO1/2
MMDSRRAILLGLAALAVSAKDPAQAHDNAHAYKPPDPATLGGPMNLRTLDGAPFTMDNLKGAWSFVYFGYSRCTSTCPIALETMSQASARLRARGVRMKSVFIDVDAPPPSQPVPRRAEAKAQNTAHGAHGGASMLEEGMRAARAIAARYPNELTVLMGSRSQLHAAVAAFRVRREHMPPRNGEREYSINHTTMIYVISPEAKVVNYAYHDATPEALARLVPTRSSNRK